jgi:hypothetical protein
MPETPAATPTSALKSAIGSRHTLGFLLPFYVLAVLWGARNIYFHQKSALDLLVPVALAWCLGWWAVVDARRRRHPIPKLAASWFFLFAFFLVPGYVIWSRRWAGGGWVVMQSALWYLLVTVSFHVGGFMIYGEAWLRAFGL